MLGTNIETGQALDGDAHIWQSIKDILTTPIGSRVMRRSYGSDVMNIIDKPSLHEQVAELYMAVVDALIKWEPRVTLNQVQLVDADETGKVTLILSLIVNATGKTLSGEVLIQ